MQIGGYTLSDLTPFITAARVCLPQSITMSTDQSHAPSTQLSELLSVDTNETEDKRKPKPDDRNSRRDDASRASIADVERSPSTPPIAPAKAPSGVERRYANVVWSDWPFADGTTWKKATVEENGQTYVLWQNPLYPGLVQKVRFGGYA
jgi:hypothetical protein